MFYKINLCILIFLLMYTNRKIADAYNAAIYMANHCEGQLTSNAYPVIVKDSVTVTMGLPNKTFSGMCVTTFSAASPSLQLMVHFQKVSLPRSVKHGLRVYNGDSKSPDSEITSYNGIQGWYDVTNTSWSSLLHDMRDYVSTGPFVTLSFNGKLGSTDRGFTAVISAVKVYNTRGTECPTMYIPCAVNHICIPHTRRCNGYNDCGLNDVSDEMDCLGAEHLDLRNTGLMIGSSLSLLVLVIVIIWMIVLCIKRARLMRQMSRRSRLHDLETEPHPLLDDVYQRHHGDIPPPHYPEGMLLPPPSYTDTSSHNPVELPPPYETMERRGVSRANVPSGNTDQNTAQQDYVDFLRVRPFMDLSRPRLTLPDDHHGNEDTPGYPGNDSSLGGFIVAGIPLSISRNGRVGSGSRRGRSRGGTQIMTFFTVAFPDGRPRSPPTLKSPPEYTSEGPPAYSSNNNLNEDHETPQ